jgi:tRNA wybutosine-synthesizing protein 2
MISTPFEEIKQKLKGEIPQSLIDELPDKWEKTGDVVIVVLSETLKNYRENIGKVYANVLNCKSVLNDIGGIKGELREPDVEIIFGSSHTETIHKENNVKFKLDPQKVMFSSGNMNERIRMANISNNKETVVDLFSGVGYFSLPIAVHSKPKHIFAIEKNPVSHKFLCDNIVLNNVTDIVEPILGDNRKVAQSNIADRVIMGYFGATIRFLPIAFKCLKNNSGIIHFHDKIPDEDASSLTMEHISNEARKCGLIVNLLKVTKVKSFAPGISHYVFDLEVSQR